MSIERYDEHLNKQVQRRQKEPIIGPVERAIQQARQATGQEPVIIVVNNTEMQQPVNQQPAINSWERARPDQSGLIFVAFLCLVGVALIAMIIVSCHAAPVVLQPPDVHNLQNCHFLC